MRLRILHKLAVNGSYNVDNNYRSRSLTGKTNCLQSIASFSDHYLPDVHDLSKITVLKALRKSSKIYANHVATWTCGKSLALQVYCKCESAQSIPKFLLTVSFEPSYTCNRAKTKKTDDVATVLWTSTRMSTKALSWVPNHFVPLLAFNKAKCSWR